MGQQASGEFCSTQDPHGYNDRFKQKVLPSCTAAASDAMDDFQCGAVPWDLEDGDAPLRMQITSIDNIRDDRINSWTKDIQKDGGGCGLFTDNAICAAPALAPRHYLADTQANGQIVLDSTDGPLWMDDAQDSRVVDAEYFYADSCTPGKKLVAARLRYGRPDGDHDGQDGVADSAKREMQTPRFDADECLTSVPNQQIERLPEDDSQAADAILKNDDIGKEGSFQLVAHPHGDERGPRGGAF